jgi:hypothetical protein
MSFFLQVVVQQHRTRLYIFGRADCPPLHIVINGLNAAEKLHLARATAFPQMRAVIGKCSTDKRRRFKKWARSR